MGERDHGGADLPDVPRPFAEEPRQLTGQGCGKAALLGCGALILLFGVGMVLLAMNLERVMVWIVGQLESQIERGLPEDLPEEERARLGRAFDDFERAALAGEMSQASMASLQARLMETAEDVPQGLTREQVRELTLALERAAGTEEGEPPPANGPPASDDGE
jgi:Na+-transporting methylmalonyl-CoA/oxaloacetate decarboxylase gamma subunit